MAQRRNIALPRPGHVHRIPEQQAVLYTEYPETKYSKRKTRDRSFRLWSLLKKLLNLGDRSVQLPTLLDDSESKSRFAKAINKKANHKLLAVTLFVASLFLVAYFAGHTLLSLFSVLFAGSSSNSIDPVGEMKTASSETGMLGPGLKAAMEESIQKMISFEKGGNILRLESEAHRSINSYCLPYLHFPGSSEKPSPLRMTALKSLEIHFLLLSNHVAFGLSSWQHYQDLYITREGALVDSLDITSPRAKEFMKCPLIDSMLKQAHTRKQDKFLSDMQSESLNDLQGEPDWKEIDVTIKSVVKFVKEHPKYRFADTLNKASLNNLVVGILSLIYENEIGTGHGAQLDNKNIHLVIDNHGNLYLEHEQVKEKNPKLRNVDSLKEYVLKVSHESIKSVSLSALIEATYKFHMY